MRPILIIHKQVFILIAVNWKVIVLKLLLLILLQLLWKLKSQWMRSLNVLVAMTIFLHLLIV